MKISTGVTCGDLHVKWYNRVNYTSDGKSDYEPDSEVTLEFIPDEPDSKTKHFYDVFSGKITLRAFAKANPAMSEFRPGKRYTLTITSEDEEKK
jgi:hypothetical protein